MLLGPYKATHLQVEDRYAPGGTPRNFDSCSLSRYNPGASLGFHVLQVSSSGSSYQILP